MNIKVGDFFMSDVDCLGYLTKNKRYKIIGFNGEDTIREIYFINDSGDEDAVVETGSFITFISNKKKIG